MAAIKTTGEEFKKFYTDKTVWFDDSCYHDELELFVDGCLVVNESQIANISDASKVVLEAGCFFSSKSVEPEDLLTVFRRWKRNNKINKN